MSRSTRPLVLALLALLLGLLPGLRFSLSPAPSVMIALFALMASFIPRHHERSGIWFLAASFVAAGAALGGIASDEGRSDCRALLGDGAALDGSGVLEASARPVAPDELPPLLPVEASLRAGTSICHGRFRISLPHGSGAIAAGSRLRLQGNWRLSAAPVMPSGWPDDPMYSGFLIADSAEVTAQPSLVRNPLLTLRGRTESRLYRLFPGHAALANALLLGRREALDPEVREKFARSGLVHLLAISGAHVALLAGVLLLLGSIIRVPPRVVAYATIALVWTYLAMIGAPSSAVRSGLMITLALVGVLLQRPSAAIPIVAAAALLILVCEPMVALDPGFQLSFAGVLGLLAVRHGPMKRLPPKIARNKVMRALAEAVLMSVGAFLATMPVAAFHFGSIAPIAIAANLPAVPLTSLALVGVAAAAVTDLILPPVAVLLASGAGLALDAIDRIAGYAATVPYGTLPTPRPRGWVWLIAAVSLVAAFDVARRLRPKIRITVSAGVALSVLFIWPPLVRAAAEPLEIHFIDVGQGDAIAIRTPAARWILIDTGPRSEQSDAGERRVLPFLRKSGAARLEVLILTHPDADHIGGAAAVLRGIPVGRLIEPGLAVGKQQYLELLEVASDRGVLWNAAISGRTLTMDAIRMEFLWPDRETLDGQPDANHISAIVRLSFGDFAALFTGDASSEVEELLVARHGGALRSQLLKAGHHGSRTSTSARLLEAVDPELFVISSGRRNRYGHPAPEVVERVKDAGVQILRTDQEGTIGIRVAPGGKAWERIVP